jgi:hypothetical protein
VALGLLKTIGRIILAIARWKARSTFGIVNRPGGGGSLNLPTGSVADQQERLAQSLGYETRRIGPIVWVVNAPPNWANVDFSMPEMWARDP